MLARYFRVILPLEFDAQGLCEPVPFGQTLAEGVVAGCASRVMPMSGYSGAL